MAEVTAQFPVKLEFLFRPMRYKVAHGGRGCLAPGSKVIMADGSLRNIEDVAVGDKMMGPDGKPRTVLRLFSGREQMYRIKQTSAQDYVVNGAHILVLRKSAACKNDRGELFGSGNYRRPNGRYPDYPDEVEISVEDWLKKSARWRENFRGFRAGLIGFPKKEVRIDPYLLGLWLGDGLHRELMITSADQEIQDWLKSFAEQNGLRYTESKKRCASNKAVDVRLSRIPAVHGRTNPVWAGFKYYGVVSNKHIPEDYIVNDEDTRLKLLAGLIDSDGHYARGGYSIALANESLARSVKRLADTLGFRTSITEKETKYGEFRGRAWRVSINGATDKVPCVLPRKQATVRPNKDKLLSQVSVEPVGEGEFYGVLLDGDHRFLLEDGTVTHNSGKSWGFARALLILGAQSQTRVICAREVQKSIKESVHRLLSDQIQALGLGGFYEVLDTEIRGRNGTTFSFSGLASHTVESIKSFEGCDLCWVEEAQSVSKLSWDILTPTIRKADSEIWVSFNPELDTDETYKRFVVNKPDNCIAVEMNYGDNPWFSDVLEQERLNCQKHAPEDYDTIWLGRCRSAVVGAIYAKEMEQAQREGRIAHVPHDPKLRTHVVFDLGWNDSMVVSFVQRLHSSVRVIDVIKDSHRTLDSYAAEIKARGYRLGTVFLPHDGYHKDYKTGKSAEEILKRFGFRVRQVSNAGIEAGIKAARQTLAQSVFDKNKAAPMVDALKRYRRAINSTTQEPGAPLHDDASHGADNYRYIALCAEQMTNEDEGFTAVTARYEALDPEMGY